ncbi:hypothetical protein Goklo_026881, partial [Gossypium klotzschianum]|nr:hypothetical protein [Gossypium klotzschianum]
MARDQLAMPISISAPCIDISVMTTNPTNLNPEGMEALDKRKRKMDQEDNYPVKYFKSLSLEETKSIEDIANDSNNIDEPVGEKAEIKEALVCNQNRIEMSQ